MVFFALQTVFSSIVLAVSLLITLVSMVVWQRNVRHNSAGPRHTNVPSTPSSDAGCTNAATTPAVGGGAHVQKAVSSPPQSPSEQSRNYQACAASLNCSGEWSRGFFAFVLFLCLSSRGSLKGNQAGMST